MDCKRFCLKCVMALAWLATPASAEVRAVTVVDDSACVEVELVRDGGPTPWRAYTLDGPPRLVVEVDRQRRGSISADFKSLAITTAEMQPTDDGIRLIMPLAEPFAIDSVEDGADIIRVRLMPTTAETFRAESEGLSWPRADAKLVFDLPLVRLDPRAQVGSAAHTFAVDLRVALLATGAIDVAIAGEEDAATPSLVLALASDRDEMDATVASPVAEAGADTLASVLGDAGIAATQTVAGDSVPTLRLSAGIATFDADARAALIDEIASAVVAWTTRTATP